MKKFFSLMVAVATLFAFTACEGNDTPEPTNPTKCSKPSLKVVDKGDDYFTIEWKAVAGAASYFVECAGNTQIVTEPKAEFTDVAPGEYVVRVMAVAGEGYTDSDYAEIKVKVLPEDTKDWFTQSVELGENAEDGFFKHNSFYSLWKGTGLVSIKVGVFPSSTSGSYSNEQIEQYLEEVKEEYVVSANSEDGCKLVWAPVDAATEYEIIAVAENEFGYKLFQRSLITTDDAPMADYVAEWLGTWTVTADQTMEYYADGEYLMPRILDESYEMTWETAFYPVYSDTIMILGVSRVFPMSEEYNFPALARVREDKTLELIAGIQVAAPNGDYAPFWCPSFFIDEKDLGHGLQVYWPFEGIGVDEETGESLYFAPYTFKLEGTTAVSTANEATLTATAQDGTKTEYEAVVDNFDIYAVTNQGGVYVYGSFDNGATVKVNTGTLTMVKDEAAKISAKKVSDKELVLMPGVMKTKFQVTL